MKAPLYDEADNGDVSVRTTSYHDALTTTEYSVASNTPVSIPIYDTATDVVTDVSNPMQYVSSVLCDVISVVAEFMVTSMRDSCSDRCVQSNAARTSTNTSLTPLELLTFSSSLWHGRCCA
jgi:hypothetical protein